MEGGREGEKHESECHKKIKEKQFGYRIKETEEEKMIIKNYG